MAEDLSSAHTGIGGYSGGGAGSKQQERKMTKKEMVHCAKKLPYLVGLELVACEVFGGVIGSDKAKQIFLPPFKTAVIDSEHDNGVEGDFFQPLDVERTPENITACQDTNLNGKEARSSSSGTLLHPGNCHVTTMSSWNKVAPSQVASLDGCEPLDLSVTPASRDLIPVDDLHLSIPLPQTKRKGQLTKRSYTEEVLAAAISDVRAGKLGTRRAAAIYGVPRSTLRNKVFRNNPNRRAGASATTSSQGQGRGQATPVSSKRGASSATEKQQPAHPPSSWDLMLDEVRRKHDLQAGFSRPFGMPPLFYNNECLLDCERAFSLSDPFSYDTKIPVLRQLVAKVAKQMLGYHDEHKLHGQQQRQVAASSSSASAMGDKGSRLKMPFTLIKDRSKDCDDSLPFESSNKSTVSGGEKDGSRVKANDEFATSGHVTLKDIISKTVVSKVLGAQRAEEDLSTNRRHFKQSDSSSASKMFVIEDMATSAAAFSNDYVMMDMTSPSLSANQEERNTNSDASAGGDKVKEKHQSAPMGNKRVRPKRGQYRRYKMELLMEAVRAVQHGEMSVHRAGSYYGVPHSTLEYKVKERHLLRQKKLAAAAAKLSPSSSDNTAFSAAATANEGADAKSRSLVSPSPSFADEASAEMSPPSKEASNRDNSSNSGSGTSTCDDFEGENTQTSERSASAAPEMEDLPRTVADHLENVSRSFHRSVSSFSTAGGYPFSAGCSSLAAGLLAAGNPVSFPSHPASFLSNFTFPWSPFLPMPSGLYPQSPGASSLFVNPPAPPHGMFASELLKSLQFKANSLNMASSSAQNSD